jgi:ribosomal protein L37AE/L43A
MSGSGETARRRGERCPRCRDARLQPTGAYWVCDACGLAITQQALRVDEAGLETIRAPEQAG